MTPEQIEHEREAYTAWLKTPAKFPNLSLALQAWLARSALDRGDLPELVEIPEGETDG